MSAIPVSPPSLEAQLAALARLSELLRSGRSGKEIVADVLAALPHILPADAWAVWRFDPRDESWRLAGSVGLSDANRRQTLSQRADDTVLLEKPLFVDDVANVPFGEERRAFYASEGIASLYVMPLHVRGEAAGTLVCYYRRRHALTPEEQHLGSVLAEIVSLALGLRKFDRFAEAARSVAAELDVHRLVQSVTDAATELTNARFGAFFYNVVDQQGESYMLYAISGVPREAFSRFPMPRNTEVFAPTFAGTAIVRSADIRRDPRYGKNAPYHGMPAGHLPVVSYLAVPVVSRSGEVLGGLFFGHEDEGVFTESEEQIAVALATQAAVGIDNARLYDALQRERARLGRSEARYRSLVLATPSPQAIWVMTPEGNVEEDLPTWRTITGQTPDEILGTGWLDAVHPADRERVANGWAVAIEMRSPIAQLFRLRTRNGSYRWFSANGVPVTDERGAIVEWVGTAVDVHDKKTADDGLRFLAKASDLFASSLDYETTLATVARLAVPEIADWCTVSIATGNDGSYRRLALEHVDPAKIAVARELQSQVVADPEKDVITGVIRSGKSTFIPEISEELIAEMQPDPQRLRVVRELGLLSLMVVPLRTRGRVLGAVTFAASHDSGRRFTPADLSLAEELAHRAAVAIDNAALYSAAQAANRTKDEFLATLSHELRTPMTAILGWARMLKLGLDENEQNEAVDAIEKSAGVQTQLIEDILDMSRIMSGKMQINTAPLELPSIAAAALSTLAPAAKAKGIELVTSFAPDVPRVLGDASRLQQVIWNLLTNAIKFTPRGGTVALRVHGDATSVRLSVRDTGKGVDPAFLPYIFEPFRQQDSSTTRAYGGIGLGLAIVRYIVELHGGRISAFSEGEGRGATFTVELPVLEPGAAGGGAARDRAGFSAEPQRDMVRLDGRHVLVIDDQEYTRDVVGAILRRCGATVSTASSAREGLEATLDARPDVVICDIAMPHEDGYAFIRQLRDAGTEAGRTPVIALTAFGRPEDRENALMHGFDAYMKKPVEPADLARAVADLAP